jgi:hypothetical protein
MRLQKLDEQNLPDHHYLDATDECYYLSEYTPRQGPHYSSTNDLIINLKKPVDRIGRPEYRYKIQAIQTSSETLRSVISAEFVSSAVWIPVPSSKAKNDPLYDDRIIQILQRLGRGRECSIRELIIQTTSLEGFHDGSRLSPEELLGYYEIDENFCAGEPPPVVAIFDDMLTTGSHFKAVSTLVRSRWPETRIVGIFIARRYIPRSGMEPGDL